jgi:hypothetical protein
MERARDKLRRFPLWKSISLFLHPMIHNCVPSVPSQHFTLSQTNPINIFTIYSLRAISIFPFMPRFSKRCLPPSYPLKFLLLKCCINFCSILCVLHVQFHIMRFLRSSTSIPLLGLNSPSITSLLPNSQQQRM